VPATSWHQHFVILVKAKDLPTRLSQWGELFHSAQEDGKCKSQDLVEPLNPQPGVASRLDRQILRRLHGKLLQKIPIAFQRYPNQLTPSAHLSFRK